MPRHHPPAAHTRLPVDPDAPSEARPRQPRLPGVPLDADDAYHIEPFNPHVIARLGVTVCAVHRCVEPCDACVGAAVQAVTVRRVPRKAGAL